MLFQRLKEDFADPVLGEAVERLLTVLFEPIFYMGYAIWLTIDPSPLEGTREAIGGLVGGIVTLAAVLTAFCVLAAALALMLAAGIGTSMLAVIWHGWRDHK